MSDKRWRWACITGLLALLLGARAMQSWAVRSATLPGLAQVAVVRVGSDVEAAVRQAVAQIGGLDRLIRPGDDVVVKPNLVMDAPADSGMVTDPAVTRAVVRLAQEAGAGKVIIAEGSAQYREGDANRDRLCTLAAFRVAGYDGDGDMVDDATGVPLVDLDDSGGTDAADPAKVTRVVVPNGLIRQEYWLPNVVVEADVFISVPVLKNHYLAGVTLGLKNQIGLLPNDLYHGPGNIYGKQSLSHSPVDLDQHIVDVNLARRPDLVVVDGQRGMIDGPVGSQVIQPTMSLILAGQDAVAVDTVGSLIMGYDPGAIHYIQLAGQSGLGVSDTARIRVVGPALADVRRDFPAPYADSSARRAEAEPPKVALTLPGESEWSGAAGLLIEAGDNDGIARVEVYLDGKLLGQVIAPPYQFELDTRDYPAGSHRLRAVAFDRSLNQAEASSDVVFVAPTPTQTAQPSASPIPPTAVPSPTATAAPTATPLPKATSSPTPARAVRSATPVRTQAPTATFTSLPSPSQTPALASVAKTPAVPESSTAVALAEPQGTEDARAGRLSGPALLLGAAVTLSGVLVLGLLGRAVVIAAKRRGRR